MADGKFPGVSVVMKANDEANFPDEHGEADSVIFGSSR